MKKISILSLVLLLTISVVSGQQIYSNLKEALGNKAVQGPQGREGINCPPNTLYSHLINSANGYTSMTNSPFTVYDKIETAPAGTVNSFTFFGLAYYSPNRNFQILFCHNNDGIPGASFAAYNFFITGTYTGLDLFGYPVYSYTVTLPDNLTLVAGDWVSARADGQDLWFWATGSGGDGCLYQAPDGTICTDGDVAFCLGNAVPETVPLSNWALAIGIGLILTFTAIRFRRMA